MSDCRFCEDLFQNSLNRFDWDPGNLMSGAGQNTDLNGKYDSQMEEWRETHCIERKVSKSQKDSVGSFLSDY
jgi:hypothetical protein